MSKFSQFMKHARPLLHWNYSGIFIPLLWVAIPGAMLGIAGSVSHISLLVMIASASLFLGVVWTIGFWITSDVLSKKDPDHWANKQRKKATKRDYRMFRLWRSGGVFTVVFLAVGSWLFVGWVAKDIQHVRSATARTTAERESQEKHITESPIVITPQSLDVRDADWDIRQSVEVKNATQRTLYGVWVKIVSTSGESLDDIVVEPENRDESLMLILGDAKNNVTMNYDTMYIHSVENRVTPCILMQIYRLEGLKSKFIRIIKKQSIGKSKYKLSLHVMGFRSDTVSLPTATRDNQVCVMLSPPGAEPRWLCLQGNK